MTASLAMNLRFWGISNTSTSSWEARASPNLAWSSGPADDQDHSAGRGELFHLSVAELHDRCLSAEIPPVSSLRDYLIFASFFPQLVAGPIVRPKYFVPQMAAASTVHSMMSKALLYLFLLGYIKRGLHRGQHLAVCGPGFRIRALTAIRVDHAVWLYATQIFCDFSGYSDMAIAVAGCLATSWCELRCTLSSGLHPGLLAPLAYLAVELDSRLHLHLTGR